MPGIPAVDVECRIGLGIAKLDRLRQCLGIIKARLLHPGQDVVARAIENAVDRFDAVADKGIAERLDDRNPSGDRRFKEDRHLMLAGQGKNLLPPLGQQRLVSGDHDPPRADGCRRQIKSLRCSSNQLDDDPDFRIIQQLLPAVGEKLFRGGDIARLLQIAHDDPAHGKAISGTLRNQIAVPIQILIDPGTHGAKACQSNADLLHKIALNHLW